jgi:hypothetical protein
MSLIGGQFIITTHRLVFVLFVFSLRDKDAHSVGGWRSRGYNIRPPDANFQKKLANKIVIIPKIGPLVKY